MPYIFTLPKLSNNSNFGYITNWIKTIGDEVVVGEVLAEVSSDDIPGLEKIVSPQNGILLYTFFRKNIRIRTGSNIAIIGNANDILEELIQEKAKQNDALNNPFEDNKILQLEQKIELALGKIKNLEILISQLINNDTGKFGLFRPNPKQKILYHLSKNEIRSSLDILNKISPSQSKEIRNDAIHINSIYNRIQSEIQNQLISYEQRTIEESKLINSILILTNKIK